LQDSCVGLSGTGTGLAILSRLTARPVMQSSGGGHL
jgi:hypothetical protein